MKPFYYVTTPIYYVNGQPHVGSALTTVACDVHARYEQLRGRQTWLLTGTDENATKVVQAAETAGIPPAEFVQRLSASFEECWRQLHIANNDFIRTTEPRHARAVQEFVRRLIERGYIYPGSYEGWYSVSDETFFRDSEVKDGIATETGKPVVRVQEPGYFFKLSAFGDRLLDYIGQNPEFLQPEFRRNEVLSFVREGLRDMYVTRPNRGWGIPVPGDEGQVVYVWFDALINYLAAIGWPADPKWELFWPADLHLVGKEIFVRFHATLWPAMLMALDLPLPRTVFAHGWFTVQGAKGGKTGASLPHPTRFIQFIHERSGAPWDMAADAVRYVLCREMNFGMDSEFSVESCLRRFNTDLANDLGNLLNRTTNMVWRYYDGVVPEGERDTEIAAVSLQVREDFERAMAQHRLNEALETIWRLVARMNKYIDERAPWALAKQGAAGDEASRAMLATVLYACLEATRIVALLASPFMPEAAAAVRRQLGDSEGPARWDDLDWGSLRPGARVQPPEPLFPRIQQLAVDEATLFALGSANTSDPLPTKAASAPPPAAISDKPTMTQQTSQPAPAPGTPLAPPSTEPTTISIDDFVKIQLRAGEILAAEPVPGAAKLLRLTIDLGDSDVRTILAGIAEFYKAEELVGRQVAVVVNLQPRKMRGIESQGMLLAADVDGRAVLLHPDSPVPNGSRVR